MLWHLLSENGRCTEGELARRRLCPLPVHTSLEEEFQCPHHGFRYFGLHATRFAVVLICHSDTGFVIGGYVPCLSCVFPFLSPAVDLDPS